MLKASKYNGVFANHPRLKGDIMEHYASKTRTEEVLTSLGFTYSASADMWGSPKRHPGPIGPFGLEDVPVCQVAMYQCRNGYWCVETYATVVDGSGGWQAPIAWDGPKADWDNSDTTDDFIKYLDENYQGWR